MRCIKNNLPAPVVLIGVIVALGAVADCAAESDGLPRGTVVLDPDVFLYSWPYPTISPDGKHLAYVSQGFVCVTSIENPAPIRIKEVPHSWTWPHLQGPKGRTLSTGTFAELSRGLDRDKYRKVRSQVTNTVHGLIWTRASSGFVFGVQSYDSKVQKWTNDSYFASTDGQTKLLAHTGPESLTRSIIVGELTQDRKYLVSTKTQLAHPNYRPLIWNIQQNRPRATPYLNLTPSPTSNRWIAIEKDTNQLVLLDDQFEVVKRFAERVPERSFGFRLDWSPDERFVLWRNQIGFDHFSNWEGFRLDLKTGAKRQIEGRFMSERIAFTGRGGEFYRCGQTGARTRGYDKVVGAHLTIVPNGDAAEIDVWRIVVDPKGKMPGALTNRPGDPPVHYDPTTDMFVIGLPRPAGERSGFVWHLMNRTGKSWQIPGADNGEYHSPFELVSFADEGKLLIAHDDKQLFSFPVSAVILPDE